MCDDSKFELISAVLFDYVLSCCYFNLSDPALSVVFDSVLPVNGSVLSV